MLGRTANDLFWMSRYIERAENIARLLEVGYRIALLPREGHGQDEEWRSTLRSAGCDLYQGYLMAPALAPADFALRMEHAAVPAKSTTAA